MKLKWYYYRLKAMSLRELISRFIALFKRIEDYNIDITDFKFNLDNYFEFDYSNISCEEGVSIFDKNVPNVYSDWFNTINKSLDWASDNSSNDFRHKPNFDEVRYTWELNRLLHIPSILLTSLQTDCGEGWCQVETLILDWLDKNPFMHGINWASVMEVAIRNTAFVSILYFFEKYQQRRFDAFRDRLKFEILRNTYYIKNNLSGYSSANNHLIIEAYSLLVSSLVFENNDWYEVAIEILEREIQLQVWVDGVSKEQAIHYQAFVMEAYLLAQLLLKRNRLSFSNETLLLLKKMCEYVTDVRNCNGISPSIGDSDDAILMNLANVKCDYYEYVLQLATLVFDVEYSTSESYLSNVKVLTKHNSYMKAPYDKEQSKIYKYGGYAIFKSNNQVKIDLTFDFGPLGFGSLAAHGHSDALSIILSINGSEVFIDPGTYIYNIEREWRDYFRKTINHNTLCVNNIDQSQMLGSFLWGKKAKATLKEFRLTDEYDFIRAFHDGYKPIIHEREVRLEKQKNIIFLKDTLNRNANAIQTFILSPLCEIIEHNERNISLIINDDLLILENSGGSITVVDAWYSPSFGVKEKTRAIKIHSTCKEIITTIKVGESNEKTNSGV